MIKRVLFFTQLPFYCYFNWTWFSPSVFLRNELQEMMICAIWCNMCNVLTYLLTLIYACSSCILFFTHRYHHRILPQFPLLKAVTCNIPLLHTLKPFNFFPSSWNTDDSKTKPGKEKSRIVLTRIYPAPQYLLVSFFFPFLRHIINW